MNVSIYVKCVNILDLQCFIAIMIGCMNFYIVECGDALTAGYLGMLPWDRLLKIASFYLQGERHLLWVVLWVVWSALQQSSVLDGLDC